MKRGTGWPIAVTAVLVVFVSANLWMMRLAGDDPAFAIEPDYYRKAVAYDTTMAERRRSAALGWSASTSIAAGAARGESILTVSLADSTRQPIDDAAVTVTARFNARANDVQSATLHRSAAGRYDAPLAVTHAGEWEVRIDAVRGAEHFVTSTRTVAPAVR